jgi:hypothetical protein
MSTALTLVSDGSNLPAALGPDFAAAVDLAKAEKAASTRKGYGTDFRLFRKWCVRCPQLLRRWRPIWRPMPARQRPQPLAAVSLPSDTPTSWRASLCRPMQKASRLPCGASAAPLAAPGYRGPRGGRQDAWDGRHGPGQAGWPAGLCVALAWLCRAFRRSELVALDVVDLEENETGLLKRDAFRSTRFGIPKSGRF